jgi:hypothetical protein
MTQHAPVLHLRQSEEYGVFDFYRSLFTRLWEDGEAAPQQSKEAVIARG